MKWLKENGCPLDFYHTLKIAKHFNNLEIIKWLEENGCGL